MLFFCYFRFSQKLISEKTNTNWSSHTLHWFLLMLTLPWFLRVSLKFHLPRDDLMHGPASNLHLFPILKPNTTIWSMEPRVQPKPLTVPGVFWGFFLRRI
ncbi:unnamed protein product [Durusdinium trenchii]|uniref:Uncharacterized protein n=1 Tax=Durusdinium trenchii TaxID=1381693 RepID=A0ABP0N0F9_9DINO